VIQWSEFLYRGVSDCGVRQTQLTQFVHGSDSPGGAVGDRRAGKISGDDPVTDRERTTMLRNRMEDSCGATNPETWDQSAADQKTDHTRLNKSVVERSSYALSSHSSALFLSRRSRCVTAIVNAATYCLLAFLWSFRRCARLRARKLRVQWTSARVPSRRLPSRSGPFQKNNSPVPFRSQSIWFRTPKSEITDIASSKDEYVSRTDAAWSRRSHDYVSCFGAPGNEARLAVTMAVAAKIIEILSLSAIEPWFSNSCGVVLFPY